MGSIISLGINKMEIDWGKNNNYINHSNLFQKNDFEQEIPYYYINEDDKEVIEYKKGAKKKLREVKQRLDLLGYSLLNIEKLYNSKIKEYEYYMGEKINITFNDLFFFFKSLEISKVDNIFTSIDSFENGYDLGEYFNYCILKDKEVLKKIKDIIDKIRTGYENLYFFMESIDPYIILRILSENELNLDYYVEWRYNDIIENEWEKKENIIKELDKKNKILIVTEGKSDTFVIKKTIENLYPNIIDFFQFIDMEDNYPFTSTGNLSNFCMGLAKINIENNVIILFDNDAEGIESFNKVKNMYKPNNLLVCHLPDLDEFKNMQTIGPFGKQIADINGKAVAIECFLDFKSIKKEPLIRWNNYKKQIGEYQGELVEKDLYVRKFKDANLLDGQYDCIKLRLLIDYIIKLWIERENFKG